MMTGPINRAAKAMAESEGWRWSNSDGPTNMVERCGSGQDSSRSRETWRKRAIIAAQALKYEDGTDEETLIRVSTQEQVEAVSLSCAYDAMLDAAIRGDHA